MHEGEGRGQRWEERVRDGRILRGGEGQGREGEMGWAQGEGSGERRGEEGQGGRGLTSRIGILLLGLGTRFLHTGKIVSYI